MQLRYLRYAKGFILLFNSNFMRKSSGAIPLVIVVILFTVAYALFLTFQSFITSNIALLTFLGVLITVFSLLYSMHSQSTIPTKERRVKEPIQELKQLEESQSSISAKRILMVIAILGIIIGIIAYQGSNHIDTPVTPKPISATPSFFFLVESRPNG